jgi:hypothetical protein
MAKRKKSKYHVDITKGGIEKRTYNGEVFDSLTEMRFLTEFILPKMESGEILRYERQVPFILQEGFTRKNGSKVLPIKYVSDFIVYWKDGSRTVFDVKGLPDNLSKCKRKIFWKRYPDEEYIWMCRNIKYGDESHWLTYEELEKKKKEEKKTRKDGK